MGIIGSTSGDLVDRATQRWVQVTGRRIDLARDDWLQGPVGRPEGIGRRFFDDLAGRAGWSATRDREYGLMPSMQALAGPTLDPRRLHPAVIDFYERTGRYDLDAWGEWCGAFRPFGRLLGLLFSRRLQQLNVPISSLDTSRGVTSEIVRVTDPGTGRIVHTAWVRELVGTGQVLYAGSYSVCRPPAHEGPCVKVVFPLPNGNAIVIMKASHDPAGALILSSVGPAFGHPGFYFTVHGADGTVWARYLRTMRESIHVCPAEDGLVRADHRLTIWGRTFLRIHYRLRP